MPEFDIIFMGHDHQRYNSDDLTGKSVEFKPLVLNPANNAVNLAEADVVFHPDAYGNVTDKKITGKIVPIKNIEPDSAFMSEFAPEKAAILDFVSRKIGYADGDFSVRDSYFGPSSFMTLLHDLQLEISGADISFAAPLSFDAKIHHGDLTMSEMFKLYKYENMLYTMELTGAEIKDYLEMSYSLWTDQMNDEDDHLLSFADETHTSSKGDYAKLRNPAYNFDSASGIIYEVDVTKPRGSKIRIISMSDGQPFDLDKKYKVAINSYRGNGGGDLLTEGAGIPHDQLTSRILSATDKDLRYYLIKAIEKKDSISPSIDMNWKFVPEKWAIHASKKDRKILFGD